MKKILLTSMCALMCTMAVSQANEPIKTMRTMTVMKTDNTTTTYYLNEVAEVAFGTHDFYLIEVSNKEHGNVEGEGYYELGDDVTLIAKPNEHYRFSHWQMGKKKETSPTLMLTVMGSVTNIEAVFVIDNINGQEYVDLGLSKVWAKYNVGAATEYESGDFFAWGETTTKTTYDIGSYSYFQNMSPQGLTKYCLDDEYGLNGYVDGLTDLELSDDAARANMGGLWTTPTLDDWQELIDNCDWEYVENEDIIGYRVKSKTIVGAEIFLPMAGLMRENKRQGKGIIGLYHTTKHYDAAMDESYSPMFAKAFVIDNNSTWMTVFERYEGGSVRGVCEKQ